METLTTEERVKIVTSYYKCGDSNVTTLRALRGGYGRHSQPTLQGLGNIINTFEETGSGSLWRILHLDLHLHPYKLTQQLKPADHSQRRRYADWVLEQQAFNADFTNKIVFRDEAHFSLCGYVNKLNCRIWGLENPEVIMGKPLHPEKVAV